MFSFSAWTTLSFNPEQGWMAAPMLLTPPHKGSCFLQAAANCTLHHLGSKKPKADPMLRLEENNLCLQMKNSKSYKQVCCPPKANTSTHRAPLVSACFNSNSSLFFFFFCPKTSLNPSLRDWFLWKPAHQQTAHPTFFLVRRFQRWLQSSLLLQGSGTNYPTVLKPILPLDSHPGSVNTWDSLCYKSIKPPWIEWQQQWEIWSYYIHLETCLWQAGMNFNSNLALIL